MLLRHVRALGKLFEYYQWFILYTQLLSFSRTLSILSKSVNKTVKKIVSRIGFLWCQFMCCLIRMTNYRFPMFALFECGPAPSFRWRKRVHCNPGWFSTNVLVQQCKIIQWFVLQDSLSAARRFMVQCQSFIGFSSFFVLKTKWKPFIYFAKFITLKGQTSEISF